MSTYISENIYSRREKVFLILSAAFIASMTLLNVLGITRFIQLGPLVVSVGVLAYPLTFLCTDLISELYGKRRASFLVWLGFSLNIFILFIMFLGQWLDAAPESKQPPWQILNLAEPIHLPNGETVQGETPLFYLVYACTAGSMAASMIAYMTAQLCDVHIFHLLKQWTHGRALWLRNNCSTLISQGVDSTAVISIVFGAAWYSGEISSEDLVVIFWGNYAFKIVAALIDTLPCYAAVHYLKAYIDADPSHRE